MGQLERLAGCGVAARLRPPAFMLRLARTPRLKVHQRLCEPPIPGRRDRGIAALRRSAWPMTSTRWLHLRYPTIHRRRWRWTNLLERSLAEVKRRSKVIGRSSACGRGVFVLARALRGLRPQDCG